MEGPQSLSCPVAGVQKPRTGIASARHQLDRANCEPKVTEHADHSRASLAILTKDDRTETLRQLPTVVGRPSLDVERPRGLNRTTAGAQSSRSGSAAAKQQAGREHAYHMWPSEDDGRGTLTSEQSSLYRLSSEMERPQNLNRTMAGTQKLRSAIAATKRQKMSKPNGMFFGSSGTDLDVYTLDFLNTDDLMERDRLTYSPRHRQRHCADQDNFSDMSDFSSVPIPVGERPSLTSMDILNIVPSEVSAGSEAASTSSVCASPGPDTSDSEKQTRAMRATSQMGLDGARMEQENVILARYTAELNKDNVAEAMCSSRLPHLILALSGVLPCGAGKLPGHYKRFVCSACFFTGAYSLYTLLSQGVNILSTVCVCYSLGGGVGLFFPPADEHP